MLSSEQKVYHTQLLILSLSAICVIALVLVLKSHYSHISCPIRSVLEMKCPGCGGTSAMKHLLKGDFQNAIASNVLFILSLFILFLYNLYFLIARFSNKSVKVVKINLNLGISTLIVISVFTVLRNL